GSEASSPLAPSRRARASAVVFEISNASRFAALTTDFFAHAIVTVAPPRAIASMRLTRDGEAIDERTPTTSAAADGPLAVTGMPGAYSDGAAWYSHDGDEPCHAQADWRVRATGWYRVVAKTTDGDEIASDAVFFDADHPESHALTAARLEGSDFVWRWQGYGEELPLAEVEATGGADRWWYPRRTYARVFGSFGDDRFDLRYGPEPAALRLFRDGDGDPVPEAPGERISFLEPASFDGLYTWLRETKHRDPSRAFRLEDGRLRISGEALGYIGTRRAFRDYLLTLEYRWGERNHGERIGKARDSGVFLHAVGPDGNSADGDGAFRSAIECQIMEGATGDLMLIRGRDREGELIPLELSSKVGAEKDEEGWPTFDPSGRSTTIRVWGRVNRLGKD